MYLNQYKTELFDESWKGALTGLALGASSLLGHGAAAQPPAAATNTVARAATVSVETQEGFNLAFHFIQREENNKANKKGGWDNTKQRWFLHRSVEGGMDTIAYGHKLSSRAEAARFRDGITDEEAHDLLYTDLIRSYNNVLSKLGRSRRALPTTRYGVAMLLDIEFNVRNGIAAFPKFVDGLMTDNAAAMNKEYHRYAKIEGVKTEIGRSKAFKRTLLDPHINTLK